MIHLDRQLVEQPKGYSRFKLNVVQDSVEGSQGVDVGEIGNQRIFSTGDPLIGSIAISGSTTILFVGEGTIYLEDNGKVTVLKDLPCLAFNSEYPITGTYRTIRGCERIVYWADGINPDRYLNIDKLDQFQTCNDFSISPKLNYPSITTQIAASGGSLEYGAYAFVIEYLDSTQNVLLRTIPTQSVIIGDALNIDTFQAEAGGKPVTTNSILLQLSNVDLRAKFIRVGALTKTSGDGVTYTAHYCGQPIPVQNRKLTYRYVGFNPSNGDILTPYESLIADHVVFTTSSDITQAGNKLLRMNLKDGVHDYAEFQRAASQIGTQYIVEEVPYQDDVLTEQGDEVKAYGIGFILDDGTRTRIFHIPGPLATPLDRTIISSRFGPGDTSVKQTKRIRMTLDVSTKNAPGRDRDVFINYSFGSPIKKVTFEIKSGDNTKILESIQRTTMVNTEIQGRKLPISIKINVEDLDGAKYSKTVQFQSNLARTSFFMETQTENLFAPEDLEKWVVENTAVKDATPQGNYASSGLFGVYESSETYEAPINYCGTESFWGLDVNGQPLDGNRVRYHRVPCRTIEPLIANGLVRRIGVRFTNVIYPSPNIVGHFFVSSTYEETNRTINSAGYLLPYNYEFDAGRYANHLPNTFDNAKPTNTVNQNFITLPYLIDQEIPKGRFLKTNGYLTSSYSDNRPLFKKFFKGKEGNLQLFGKHHLVDGYEPAKEFNLVVDSRNLLSKTLTEDIPNKSLNSNFNLVTVSSNPVIFANNRVNFNYAYMKTGFVLFPFVAQIRYRLFGPENLIASSGLDNFDVFDGDSYMSKVDITNISKMYGEGIEDVIVLLVTVGLFSLFDKEQINVEYELLEGLVFESPYNYERRIMGTDNCALYYDGIRAVEDVIVRRLADRVEVSDGKDWELRDSICDEYYGNNADFNRGDPVKAFYPLSQVFDYCSKCINKHPVDIIYSETGTLEDAVDNFLVYKPNNRVSLPSDGGEIVKGDLVGNYLLIRCTNKTFLLKPNAQEMQVTDGTVNIGTGSFLAIPPDTITATSSGYAGQQSKLASVSTPFGLIWADQIAGAVYQFSGGGVTAISKDGLYHFFEQNMKLVDGEISGAVKMAYDPLFERVVLTSPKFKSITGGQVTKVDGVYYVDGKVASLSDPRLFENLSFTLSYKLTEKSWSSFHSYMPLFMYNNQKYMYTVAKDGIYTHNNWNQTAMFYGLPYPVVLEINYSDLQTFQNSGFHYYAKFEKYDLIHKVWVDVPNMNFEKAWAYNDTQSSGLVELFTGGSAYQKTDWDTRIKRVEQTDLNFRISGLRSISTGIPIASKAWDLRQIGYNNGQGYVDKAPLNVNYNMPQHEQVEFRDKVLSLRLSIQNPDVRITYHAGIFANTPSIR